MEIAFYLKRPDAASTSIFARISYEGNKLKYYLPEKIDPKYWNKETGRARETQKFKEYPEFNSRLDNIQTTIRTVFRKFVNDFGAIPSTETLKTLLDREVRKKEAVKDPEHNFFSFAEAFIKRCENGTRINLKTRKPTVRNTFKGYSTTINHLKEFQKIYKRSINFDTIDLDFYNEFIVYETRTLKLSHNTIGDHIKRIKTILNDATELGINKNLAYKNRQFAKLNEETDSIYLDEKEIEEIEKLDLSENKKLDNVRDLFLIGCYTGLRYSDYSVLRQCDIRDGFIEITQLKTDTPVTIPIHETVDKIIAKYNGHFPRNISNQKMNDYLKEIGKKVEILDKPFTRSFTKGGVKVTETTPKWENISTHTARRSFATNEYLAGTPTVTIMAITGHKTEKAFLRYIKLSSNEHAKLLKMHWVKRKQLRAVV